MFTLLCNRSRTIDHRNGIGSRPQRSGAAGPIACEAVEARCLLSAASVTQMVAPLGDLLLPVASLEQEPVGGDRSAGIRAPSAQAASPARAAINPSELTYKDPIVIKKGGVYSGNWQSLDANVPAIRVKTSQPVVIQNSVIRSRGTLIEVYQSRANVTVRNTYGYALNPEVAGRYPGRFMDVEGFANIVIDNNYMEGTSGIYLYDYEGNHTARQTVKVRRNSALNIDGRISDGNGGWTPCAADPDNYKQFFQINGVRGLVGAEVAWNQIKNLPGQSRVEENINIHGTTGTAKSPFLIHDNYIQGAFPSDDIDARRYSGGGIMLSDNGSSYLRAYNNQIVSTGHVGVTITSGHDNYFYNNRIISSGLNADGSPIPWSNVGGVVWNFNNESTFKNNGGYKNLIGWVDSSGQRNDSWTPDASRWDKNRAWPGAVTLSTETAEWNLWLKKLARVQIKVGSKYSPK